MTPEEVPLPYQVPLPYSLLLEENKLYFTLVLSLQLELVFGPFELRVLVLKVLIGIELTPVHNEFFERALPFLGEHRGDAAPKGFAGKHRGEGAQFEEGRPFADAAPKGFLGKHRGEGTHFGDAPPKGFANKSRGDAATRLFTGKTCENGLPCGEHRGDAVACGEATHIPIFKNQMIESE